MSLEKGSFARMDAGMKRCTEYCTMRKVQVPVLVLRVAGGACKDLERFTSQRYLTPLTPKRGGMHSYLRLK